MEAFIRSHIVHLEANHPPNTTPEKRRKYAIVLGAARAAMTAYFNLTSDDFIPGELAERMMGMGPTGGYKLPTGTANGAPIRTAVVLTEEERHVATVMANCALAVLPLQGYSLMTVGHHYISEANSPSRRAYQAVEKQMWKAAVVNTWLGQDKVDIQDMMWHKAGHPVKMTIKEQLASDTRIRDALKMADLGSAAARLPATESTVRALASYRALMATVGPLWEVYDGGVDTKILDIVSETLSLFPAHMEVNRATLALDPKVPAAVVDRSTALAWAEAVIDRNRDRVAIAYGFYCALMEQTQLTGAGGGSLRTAFSLKKLPDSSPASYTLGAESYKDYAAVRAAKRNRGEVTPLAVVLD
jgi:hypothetical protein